MVLLVVVVLVLAALVVLARSVRIVPAGHVGVVTRQGAYVRMVTAGLLLVPPRDRVVMVSATEQQLTSQPSVTSADGQQVSAVVRVVFHVDDPVRYLGAVDDAPYAVERDAETALRTFAGRTSAADLAASNARAAEHLRAELAATMSRWGMEVLRVEVVVAAGD